MKDSTISLLRERESAWAREKRLLATSEEIELFEREYGKIHPEYVPYLREVGYATVGSEYFDRLPELRKSIRKGDGYRGPDSPGKMGECFIFHWDGCGNPVGISWKDSKIYVDDDVYGMGMCLSDSLDDYVTELLNEK
ncbi:MAG: hypothetical protein RIS76_3999 [Verrucomicrobiota bacterium]|jgi:hypothetical protein